MDTLRGYDDDRSEADRLDEGDAGVNDAPAIGTDERRMHVRAYNHWVSLLHGRPYPSIEDLNPASIADFGPHSVLLDFTRSIEDPTVAFLGRSLRDECGLDQSIATIADVPSRSLLSRLTDHYLQIIANRAPIGFEAEFVGTRGHTMLYRGILMPFSSNGDVIDFIYGVINWKEMVDPATQAKLAAEVDAAVKAAPRKAASAPVWADGPSASALATPAAGEAIGDAEGLSGQLTLARASASAAASADVRSRSSLYRALGLAYDFALAADEDADGYAALLAEAAIRQQARAPMTPVVKLVFGGNYDKTRLTEFATVLSHARRTGVTHGELSVLLETVEGGIKGVVAAERALRRPQPAAPKADPAETLRHAPVLASVSVETDAAAGDFVVLVARSAGDGRLEIVGVDRDAALTARAVRHLAG